LFEKYNNSFAIVSTKDTSTIRKLLAVNGVKHIPEIYGADEFEAFGSKNKLISHVMGKELIKTALFIDDSLQHLSICSDIPGLIGLQPNWGYLGPDDIGESAAVVIASIQKQLGILSTITEAK
jgi:hypothetical protein